MGTVSTFKDLRVWHEAMELVSDVYRLTLTFPKYELYGLGQQMRRAAVSIPSNIAEGKGRNSNRDLSRFLLTARGSLLELHTQILVAQRLQYVSQEDGGKLIARADGIGRGLNALLNVVREQSPIRS
jgi:four helix bundle protein